MLRRVSKFFSEKKHQAGEPGGSLDPANYLFSDLGDQLAGRKTIKYNDIFLFKFLIFLIQFGGSLVVGYKCLRLFKHKERGIIYAYVGCGMHTLCRFSRFASDEEIKIGLWSGGLVFHCLNGWAGQELQTIDS